MNNLGKGWGVFYKSPELVTSRIGQGRTTFGGDLGEAAGVGRKSGKHNFRETKKREFEERSDNHLNKDGYNLVEYQKP